MVRKYFLYGLFLFFVSCSKIDTTLPEFSLTKLDGTEINSNSLKGKIVVINVWATWCRTCLSELPELNELTEKYKTDTNIVFLAFSDESAEKVQVALQKRCFDYIQIPEASSLTNALQTRLAKTYPQHILVDKDSRIKFESSNGLENTFQTLRSEIEKLKSE